MRPLDRPMRPLALPICPYTTLFRSLPIWACLAVIALAAWLQPLRHRETNAQGDVEPGGERDRSEEHTSELQSHSDVVCGLLLDKKNVVLHESQRADGGSCGES